MEIPAVVKIQCRDEDKVIFLNLEKFVSIELKRTPTIYMQDGQIINITLEQAEMILKVLYGKYKDGDV
jgi:hypothetical protein